MLLNPLFESFLAASPLSVMARGLIEHALNATDLNALFEENAKEQYTRQVTFASLVDLIGLVVSGKQSSVCNAFQTSAKALDASLNAVYKKLQGVEDPVCSLLVEQTARD